jgi:hypothetical protein
MENRTGSAYYKNKGPVLVFKQGVVCCFLWQGAEESDVIYEKVQREDIVKSSVFNSFSD